MSRRVEALLERMQSAMTAERSTLSILDVDLGRIVDKISNDFGHLYENEAKSLYFLCQEEYHNDYPAFKAFAELYIEAIRYCLRWHTPVGFSTNFMNALFLQSQMETMSEEEVSALKSGLAEAGERNRRDCLIEANVAEMSLDEIKVRRKKDKAEVAKRGRALAKRKSKGWNWMLSRIESLEEVQ